jgi:secondary thiamine-phosphate synthase enzyme
MVVFKKIKKISTKEFELIKVTEEVREFAENCGVENGVVFVIVAHTTAGIMVNESLPCLERDIEAKLEELVPLHHDYAHSHFLHSYGAIGGNAPGHLKSMLCGNHCVIPLIDGKLVLGGAQDIYLAEFDGVQQRTVFLEVMGE